jgi:hypothetical protein
MEKWVDIKGYECIYEISNMGRIKSKHRRGGKYSNDIYLKIKNRQVSLSKDCQKKTFVVSRLVWEHFVCEIPENMIIDHIKEGDYTDNRLSNLQLITQSENSTKAAKLNRYKHGEEHHKSSVSNEVALEIFKMKKSGVKRKLILEKFNITPDVYYYITSESGRNAKFWKNIKTLNF